MKELKEYAWQMRETLLKECMNSPSLVDHVKTARLQAEDEAIEKLAEREATNAYRMGPSPYLTLYEAYKGILKVCQQTTPTSEDA